MDIMKKFGLFLIAAIAVTAFTSCNDDDGGEPLRTLITTVRTLDGGDYYFQRDNGETLYPGNKSRVPGYKPDPDKTQRVIIWFTLQNGIADYDYNIDLYFVENIYTGTSEIVTDSARRAGQRQNGLPEQYVQPHERVADLLCALPRIGQFETHVHGDRQRGERRRRKG